MGPTTEWLTKALDAHYRDDNQAVGSYCLAALRDLKQPHWGQVWRYVGHALPTARREPHIRKALAYAEAHKL